MDISDEFLRSWLPKLPADIIEYVCQELPSETIKNILLKAPKLRHIIVEIFYSKELHLIVSPTKEKHYYSSKAQHNELINIVSYQNIESFLHENPDINPHVIKVITHKNFASMEKLLTKFHSRLAQAPRLEIYIDEYELYRQDMDQSFSFPNLFKFHTHRVELDACGYTLSPLFERSQSIKELTLLQHKVFNWARIKLPVGLTYLELRFKIDPDDYWDSHVVSGVFAPLSPSMPLKSLCISGSDMQTVNVSQLPRTLERLDLSGNHFRNFESEGKSPSWPVHIKSMNLGNNKSFDDSSMKQLSQIAWPPFLETLHLGSNEVTSLEYLSNLPRSLKCLDLSRTDIKTFRVEHNDDAYPFFRFPECLESLDLQARCMEFMRTTRIDAIPLKDRIQFPSNLKYLNLSWHNKTNIANYLFPSSLETLLMEFTDINDLTRYNYIVGTEEIVSWKHLINLKTLDLRENRLKTLENWCPPKSLQNLNLGVNEIKCLTASNTPLFNGNFSEYTNNIEVLDISASTIQDIDDNVVLPRNLRTLDLGENSMKNFVFTNEFANHQTLATLDMSSGNLEQISVESPGKSQSHLKSFSISFLSCTFRMSKEEFYKVFEQIGLVVTDKNQDIEGEHLFK